MKRKLGIIGSVFSWILVVVAALITVVVLTGSGNNNVGSLFGYMTFSIQTESMEPTIMVGDLAIGTKIDDFKELKEGDIITYWTEIEGQRVLNTHRIQTINLSEDGIPQSFITKGDNNKIEDEQLVYQIDLVAKYKTKIPKLGKALDFLQTQKGFFICVVFPLILFFIYQLYKFVKVIVLINKDGNGEITQEEEEAIKKKAIEEYLAQQKEEAAKEGESVNAEETADAEDVE